MELYRGLRSIPLFYCTSLDHMSRDFEGSALFTPLPNGSLLLYNSTQVDPFAWRLP